GASATDDRRPAFQRMLDQATSAERRCDVICVHAFSRFYRNGAEMELTIRKLRKHGVDVVSVTQPTGDDPSQELMRQIIGIFDEYTSRENGKNVIRAMRESAKQGFWNGTTPPLGYRIVEAERRGSKVTKRLEVDLPAIPRPERPSSDRSSRRSKSTMTRSESLATRLLWLPSSQVARLGRLKFVVLYANGAPGEIRTHDLCLRRIVVRVSGPLCMWFFDPRRPGTQRQHHAITRTFCGRFPMLYWSGFGAKRTCSAF